MGGKRRKTNFSTDWSGSRKHRREKSRESKRVRGTGKKEKKRQNTDSL